MILSQNEYFEYLNTHLNLLFFVGHYKGILEDDMEYEEFLETNFKTKAICRETLLKENDELVNKFIEINPEIPEEQLQILEGFRKNIYGQFVLLKCLSKHAIFKNIDNEKFYAVKALSDTFEELIPDYPAIFELNILPFKGQIIYDGFIKGGSMKIGKKIMESLLQEYSEVKKNNQIITSLD
jgi:hypothetical protein